MKSVNVAVVLAALATTTNSHFTFVRLSQNGEWKAPLQYIRNKTSPYDEQAYYGGNFLYRYYNWPTYYIDRNESIRCGRDNMAHANATEILTVKAGDMFEIAQQRYEPYEWTEAMFYNCTDGLGTCVPGTSYFQDINHPGPLLIHLSKVPDRQDVRTYDGSGEWVKIFTMGAEVRANEPLHWLPYNDQKLPPRFVFKIPSQTPSGQYLMRMDIVFAGLTSQYTKVGDDLAQMYPSCAQLNIVSNFTTPFPKGVKIPEIFAPDAPGTTISIDMYDNKKIDDGYQYPGGPLWDGEQLIVDKPDLNVVNGTS